MENNNGQFWHCLETSETIKRLDTSDTEGLKGAEASARIERLGKNVLSQKKGTNPFIIFLSQFNQPLVYILIVSGLVTAILGEWVDSSVIFGVVMVNAIIGFVQEIKALRAIESLSKSMTSDATIIRDGKRTRIPASDLTLGDLVLLQSGDKVPAELRLIKSRELQIDESALTGESVAVQKQTGKLDAQTLLADRSNMAFSSTLVTYGTGTGIVVAVGDMTEIGRINQLIASADVLATPLTKSIGRFSKVLLYIILGLAGFTFMVGMLRGEEWLHMFKAAVALAVGAIPEGLPAALTITLAIGVSKMAKRNAIIRKLPAVETLGSTSVICSDKTGTLTQNQMTVQEIRVAGKQYTVSGVGYAPKGEFSEGEAIVDPAQNDTLKECLVAGSLCNDAVLVEKEQRWVIEGDPTEGALITAAQKASIEREKLHEHFPRIDAIPFESEYQYMATLHRNLATEELVVYVKGSAEKILERCTSSSGGEFDAQACMREADEMAATGLRVLAFARTTIKLNEPLSHDHVAGNLTFLGFQGMIDPPRPEAIAAIEVCHAAGVAVKMITGDHELTAVAIAQKIGILAPAAGQTSASGVINGRALAAMSDEELVGIVQNTSVFARVSPEDKLRLVRALQAKEAVIAMTGDGVNDAPALRQANIGVAMGITGTEVAKEAADMVLTDDNFASIKAAVEEGRGVYDNLVKFITWTLPTNFGEGLVILIAVLLGVALPILPVQILWINMTTAVLLGLMLAFEPMEPGIMNRPPRSPRQPVLTGILGFRIFIVGLFLCTGAFGLFALSLEAGRSIEVARTMAVNVFVMGELFFLFNCRSLRFSMFKIGLFTNPFVWAGATITFLLQLLYTHAPFMNAAFQSSPITLRDWGLAASVGLVIYLVMETEKKIQVYLGDRRERNASRNASRP